MSNLKTTIKTSAISLAILSSANAFADVQHLDDVIISFSLCVGNDCVNGESFGFDTLRLKENNTRMHFDDTSTSASFPRNDWRFIANDSSNGGASYLAIEDSTAGRQTFRVDAGAPANALRVDAQGDIGIGTASPVVNLHIAEGNTPTLRLEQNGSSGFTPQTWDVAGNETNFFVRDATNGSKLPFKIKPGAPDNALFVAADGDIGLGTASPTAALHLRRTDATAALKIEEASSSPAVRELLSMTNNGGSYMSMVNSATSDTWFITHENNSPNDLIISHSIGGAQFRLGSNGNVAITGTLTTTGTTCSSGCDMVFSKDYELESISEHAESMWKNSYLPAVGQTIENTPFNLTEKTGGMLNELEKAHIYIEQLNTRLTSKESELAVVKKTVSLLEIRMASMDGNK